VSSARETARPYDFPDIQDTFVNPAGAGVTPDAFRGEVFDAAMTTGLP
jgi:hypothetical protein